MAVECEKCGQEFKTKQALRGHMISCGKKKGSRAKMPTPEQVRTIIENWGEKTQDEWVKEFGISKNAVMKIGSFARKAQKVTEDIEPPSPFCSAKSLKALVNCVLVEKGWYVP